MFAVGPALFARERPDLRSPPPQFSPPPSPFPSLLPSLCPSPRDDEVFASPAVCLPRRVCDVVTHTEDDERVRDEEKETTEVAWSNGGRPPAARRRCYAPRDPIPPRVRRFLSRAIFQCVLSRMTPCITLARFSLSALLCPAPPLQLCCVRRCLCGRSLLVFLPSALRSSPSLIAPSAVTPPPDTLLHCDPPPPPFFVSCPSPP